MRIEVTNQEQLDAALARDDVEEIRVTAGYVRIDDDNNKRVYISGDTIAEVRRHAFVYADDRAHVDIADDAGARADDRVGVEAWGRAHVYATGGAKVNASGRAQVRATDTVTVTADDHAEVLATGRATVIASARAEVSANDFVAVEARGQARVFGHGPGVVIHARDMAQVEISHGRAVVRGSATAHAYGQAEVVAAGTAYVRAEDRARVTAGPWVAVHRLSQGVTVTAGASGIGPVVVAAGGIRDAMDKAGVWCQFHGVPVRDGVATLVKALPDDLTAGTEFGRPTLYGVGWVVECADWDSTAVCGGGLHFSPTPGEASVYDSGATRWVEVEVPLSDLVPLPGPGTPKAKAPRCKVVREVDRFGRPVARD